MDFRLSKAQQRLQQKCRELAEDFATRSAGHDLDASHPIENYQRLRDEGFLALSVAREWGGSGASFLDHTIAYEALGQGCPSTALAFNMHASVVMPLLQSTEISAEIKRRIAKMVVHDRNLIAGNFSEPITTSLIGARPLKTRAANRWRLQRQWAQDVCLDARSSGLRAGNGIPRRGHHPFCRDHPDAPARDRGAQRRARLGCAGYARDPQRFADT
jgi:alkylation response protein AidB-like acyl-CoA dehydrogenase